MKKRNLWITILLIILSLCFTMGLTACGDDDNGGNGKSGTLEKITVVVDKTEAEIGDTINLSFTTTPENPTSAHNGSSYKASCIEYYVRINGSDTRISTQKVTTTYTVNSSDDLSFWAKYCNHSTHSDTEGDLVSELVTVTIKTSTISTVDELKAIANTNKSYILANDIDLAEESNWQAIEGFSGTLNGNGHSITNLTINSVNGENIGLFGTLQGTVKDLTIENAQITARGDAGKAGIVAGTNKGTISNVTVSGNIAPEYYSYVGGLVGYNDCGIIINCINQATVIGANNVGGIVGSMVVNRNDAITGCKNEGAISGKDNVGGIAGYITMPSGDGNVTYSISNNTNENTVEGVNRVGGIFGEVYGMYYDAYYDKFGYFEMSVLTNTAEISGSSTGNDTGGIIGKSTRLTLLTTCENTADVTGGTCVGGIVGYAPGVNIKATGIENTSTITGKGKVGGFAGHAGVIEYAINNGQIVSNGVLVESGNSRAYVGGIAGYCEGLIGCENNAEIKVETNADFVGGLAGYVCVTANNRVNNNVNYGEIIGANYVGGIAGYLTMPSIDSNTTYSVSNNENKNTVTGNSSVGGIFGEVYGMYYDAYYDKFGYFEMSVLTNTAEITGSSTGNDVGGLIGKATRLTVLTTCENTANITGGTCVGGFVGYAPGVNIKATGTENNNIITGKCYLGGFAGQAGIIENAVNNGEIISTAPNSNGDTYLGGIAGYCTGAIGCVNNADIEIVNAGKYIGGIAGYINISSSNVVNDNQNYGVIVGADIVGGIAGYLTMPSVDSNVTYTVSNNKNYNTVTGVNKVSGIFGEVYGMFYDAYYDKYGYFEVINCVNEAEITGTSYVGGIVGAYTRLKTDSNIMDTNTTLYGEKLGQ